MAASRERAVAVLKHRDFRLLWSGQFVSLVGTHMQEVALGWQLYLLTGSPVQLGTLGLVRFGPILFVSLIGGAVADARDRRRLLLVTQAILATLSAVLALATQADAAGVWLIYVVTFFAATAECFDEPAREALIPQLVPPERLAQATTLSVLAHDISAVAGPALGGIAIAKLGLSATYWFNAVSFGCVMAAVLAMRARPAVPVLVGGGINGIREGLRFVRRSPVVLALLSMDFLATFFGTSLVLLPIFANEILRVGPDGLGLLYAAPSAGAVISGLVLTSLPPMRRPGWLVFVAVAIYGAAVAVFGSTDIFAIALVALAISGAADTISRMLRHSIRQLVTPNRLRGRVASVNAMFVSGGWELGNFEAGVAARLVGTPTAVVAGGLVVVGTAGVLALLSPHVLRFRIEHAEVAREA